jgi:uncharacterized protein YcbK (DUF882 family)|tara:strand:- start:99 stop:491 length:393 start_codon:yes stop_codon:yes gene_type:complete
MSKKLTDNFSMDEFECKCGCVMPEFVKKNVQELAENLQVIRDVYGKIDLTNAYRCKEHNADVGGSVNSQHLKGKAADIKSSDIKPKDMAAIVDDLMKCESFELGGIGIYNTFTHVDIRGVRARWSKTSKK